MINLLPTTNHQLPTTQLLNKEDIKMIYEISHTDTCKSSYFTGHIKPWFSILVHNKTTYKDLKEQMLEYQTTEHLENLDIDEFKLGVKALFDGLDLTTVFDPSLDDYDDLDDDYDCYAYFTVTRIEDEGEEDE